MGKAFLTLVLLALAAGAAPAQQHEEETVVGARRVTVISDTEVPLFRVGGFQRESGGTRVYLKGAQEEELLAAYRAGRLKAEDEDGNALPVRLMRECRCKDGQTVRADVGGDDCQCRTECESHGGQGKARLYILAPKGKGIGFCVEDRILVLVGG